MEDDDDREGLLGGDDDRGLGGGASLVSEAAEAKGAEPAEPVAHGEEISGPGKAEEEEKRAPTTNASTKTRDGAVRDAIVRQLEGKTFKRWVDSVNESCLANLAAVQPCDDMTKYVVSTLLYETKRGAGLELHSTTFWDPTSDASTNVSWENGSIGCIVTLFALCA